MDVSNQILDKPAQLTAEEWAVMRRHPGLSHLGVDDVLRIMGADAGTKLDATVFEALSAWLPHRGATELAQVA